MYFDKWVCSYCFREFTLSDVLPPHSDEEPIDEEAELERRCHELIEQHQQECPKQ